MSDFQNEMNQVVADFVAQITELAREAARDMIDQALDTATNGHSKRAVGTNGRGAKRNESQIAELATQFVNFVKANPGLRIEQINKALGTSTKELALPIRKLVGEGAVKTKGTRRSTAYYAAGAPQTTNGNGASKGEKGKKRSKKK